MPTPSVNNFRPGKKAFGFRSPNWVISNYFSRVQTKMINHPFFKRFSNPKKYNPPTKPKLG